MNNLMNWQVAVARKITSIGFVSTGCGNGGCLPERFLFKELRHHLSGEPVPRDVPVARPKLITETVQITAGPVCPLLELRSEIEHWETLSFSQRPDTPVRVEEIRHI